MDLWQISARRGVRRVPGRSRPSRGWAPVRLLTARRGRVRSGDPPLAGRPAEWPYTSDRLERACRSSTHPSLDEEPGELAVRGGQVHRTELPNGDAAEPQTGTVDIRRRFALPQDRGQIAQQGVRPDTVACPGVLQCLECSQGRRYR